MTNSPLAMCAARQPGCVMRSRRATASPTAALLTPRRRPPMSAARLQAPATSQVRQGPGPPRTQALPWVHRAFCRFAAAHVCTLVGSPPPPATQRRAQAPATTAPPMRSGAVPMCAVARTRRATSQVRRCGSMPAGAVRCGARSGWQQALRWEAGREWSPGPDHAAAVRLRLLLLPARAPDMMQRRVRAAMRAQPTSATTMPR